MSLVIDLFPARTVLFRPKYLPSYNTSTKIILLTSFNNFPCYCSPISLISTSCIVNPTSWYYWLLRPLLFLPLFLGFFKELNLVLKSLENACWYLKIITQLITICLQWLSKPTFFSSSSMNFQSRQSYAFSISSLRAYMKPFPFFFFLIISRISHAKMILSIHVLPLMNAFCKRLTRSSSIGLIPLTRTFEMTL